MTQAEEGQPGREVERREAKVPVPVGIPVQSLDEAWRLANALGNASVVPDDLRGKPGNILAILLYGRELGLSAWQSIQGINVVKGRPSMSAELRVAKTREAGHVIGVMCKVCGELAHDAIHQGMPELVADDVPPEQVRHKYAADWDRTRCAVKGVRGDTGEVATVEWTVEDALTAGLLQRGRGELEGKLVARSSKGDPLPWELYTRNMLYRRATNDVARILAPEVGYGLYDREEIETMPDEPSQADVVTVGEPVPDVDPEQARRQAQALQDEYAGSGS
jgi:hypothetical protein